MSRGDKLLSVMLSAMMAMGICPLKAFAVDDYDALDALGSADGRIDVRAVTTQVMYRMYNAQSGEHFYTANAGERNSLYLAGWAYEGVGWMAPAVSRTPVYRLYSGTDHHYTTSAGERDALVRAGWRYEGIGWYSDDAKGVALYRQFNPNVDTRAKWNNSGSHNYTASRQEHHNLVGGGWKDEGIGWYAIGAGYAEAANALPFTAEQRVQAFLRRYPEGTPWTNETREYIQRKDTWIHSNYGCSAYAQMFQDEIYGPGPGPFGSREVGIDDVRPYDVVWIGCSHWAFVLSVDRGNRRLTLAEGNYDGMVHIGRTISFDRVSAAYTR